MEINLLFNEDGKFVIDKSDDIGIFTAIGMLELAKKVMLDDTKKTETEVEGQLDMEEVVENEVQ